MAVRRCSLLKSEPSSSRLQGILTGGGDRCTGTGVLLHRIPGVRLVHCNNKLVIVGSTNRLGGTRRL